MARGNWNSHHSGDIGGEVKDTSRKGLLATIERLTAERDRARERAHALTVVATNVCAMYGGDGLEAQIGYLGQLIGYPGY